ncbi:MAG TPA: NAD(P)/FAD-dependent oxidoreductase [Proteobacteria bacterium]|nr:dihydropyrimidine dehydrogenase subunit A [bacterium BMS3Abin14]HDL54078.1 NAD(P)/FAD-dependent oxidoreductase [Pseudomonadota bacterium]
MNTVKIIGAGPAGLVAAIVLRRYGIPVTIFEKSPDVGHRLNGDFQGLENWSADVDITETLKDMGIEINFLCEPYFGGVIHSRGMEPVSIKSEKPIFYLVKRGSMSGTLDTGLKEQAQALGTEILFEHNTDHLAGPAIVGTGPKGADVIAVGITFDTSMEDTAIVVLDDDIASKGYAYLLVNDGYGTMATVLYRNYRRGEEFFENMISFFNTTMEMDIGNERKFGGFGNFFLRDTQVRNDKLYVGESGGFQDCLWGFGMRYSVMSGYLAARSIMEKSSYDVLWKNELGPMLEASLINRFLYERFGHAGYRFMARRLANNDPNRILKRHYNHLPVKHLLYPLARRNYVNRVKDESCNHTNCTCVWCRCEHPTRTA